MFRFTKENFEKTLKLNEGFKMNTSYKGKHGYTSNQYLIANSGLFWRRYSEDDYQELDHKTTQSFLRRYKGSLNLPGEQ